MTYGNLLWVRGGCGREEKWSKAAVAGESQPVPLNRISVKSAALAAPIPTPPTYLGRYLIRQETSQLSVLSLIIGSGWDKVIFSEDCEMMILICIRKGKDFMWYTIYYTFIEIIALSKSMLSQKKGKRPSLQSRDILFWRRGQENVSCIYCHAM